MGKNAQDILENKFPGIQKLIQETIANKSPVKNFNLEIEDLDGEVKTYLVSTAFTGKSPKEDVGVVLVLHDISEVTGLRKAIIAEQSFGLLIGASPVMKDLYNTIETIAEFVENTAIEKILIDIGVNHVQGYGITRPRPFPEVVMEISTDNDNKVVPSFKS